MKFMKIDTLGTAILTIVIITIFLDLMGLLGPIRYLIRGMYFGLAICVIFMIVAWLEFSEKSNFIKEGASKVWKRLKT